MMKYYIERSTGDYLVVDTSTREYYKRLGRREVEGRSVAIEGLPESMCTGAISLGFLKSKCKRVTVDEVPDTYKRWF